MTKFEFALQSSVLVLATHLFVNAQTNPAPKREAPTRTNQSQANPGQRPSEANVERYRERNSKPEPSSEGAKRFYKHGIRYGQTKRYREAVAAFELAIRLHPNYADAYFGLGNAFSDMGRWKEGIDAFRRAIQLNPKDNEAHARLGEINARLARDEKATPSEKRAVVQNSPAGERVGLDRRAQLNTAKSSNPKSGSIISNTNNKRDSGHSTSKQPGSQLPKAVSERKVAPSVRPSSPIGPEMSSRPMSNAKANSQTSTTSVPRSTAALDPLSNTGSNRRTTPNPVKNAVGTVTNRNPAPVAMTTLIKSRTETGSAAATPENKQLAQKTGPGTRTSSASSTPVPGSRPDLSGSTTSKAASNAKPESGTNATSHPASGTTVKTGSDPGMSPKVGNSIPNETVNKNVETSPDSKAGSASGAAPNTVKHSVPNATVIKKNEAASSTTPTNRTPETTAATITPVNKQPEIAVSKTSPETAPAMSAETPVPSSETVAATKAHEPNFPTSTDSAVMSNAASSFPKATHSADEATYRLGIGDVLDVRVSDLPVNNSTLFTVSADGSLDHPVLDEPLKVAGLTTDEVKERLRKELKQLALSDGDKITVAVRDYKSHTILVSGLVNQQGTKVLRREAIPLYVVLAEAQPLPQAGRVTVMAHDGRTTAVVNLATPEATAQLIRPGDVVVVQASPKLFFYIGGDVKKPGEWPFREGLKLTQAILLAGGLTRDSKAAEVARENSEGLLEVSTYELRDISSGKIPDPIIRPGDRIMIEH